MKNRTYLLFGALSLFFLFLLGTWFIATSSNAPLKTQGQNEDFLNALTDLRERIKQQIQTYRAELKQ